MSATYEFIGQWAAVCGVLVALSILQAILLVVVGSLGKEIWRKATRVYSLHVIWYWLNRLEREGKRCFQKAHNESEEQP